MEQMFCAKTYNETIVYKTVQGRYRQKFNLQTVVRFLSCSKDLAVMTLVKIVGQRVLLSVGLRSSIKNMHGRHLEHVV